MIAPHHHTFDRLRADPPPEADDWPDFERDATDMLDGLEIVGIYTGNGQLIALRIGGLTLTEQQVKRALGAKHFARVEWLTTEELHDARDDRLASMMENDHAD